MPGPRSPPKFLRGSSRSQAGQGLQLVSVCQLRQAVYPLQDCCNDEANQSVNYHHQKWPYKEGTDVSHSSKKPRRHTGVFLQEPPFRRTSLPAPSSAFLGLFLRPLSSSSRPSRASCQASSVIQQEGPRRVGISSGDGTGISIHGSKTSRGLQIFKDWRSPSGPAEWSRGRLEWKRRIWRKRGKIRC